MTSLLIKKLYKDSKIPTKTNLNDAGWDLYAQHDLLIPAGSQKSVKTGIAIGIPDGCYGRIAPRSGLAFKHCINVHAGVVDKGYINEIIVILFNHSKTDYNITKGDRIAQLILEQYNTTSTIKVVDNLDDTDRGLNGFGSSGC